MKHMAFNDSDILKEFGRIMQEKDGLRKTAQVVMPLTDEERGKLSYFLNELQKHPSNGPGMERWIARLKGQNELYLQAVYNALVNRYRLWQEGKSPQELTSVLLPSPQQLATTPMPAPVTGAAVNQNEKTAAEQKAYDVMPKEDLVHEAHPHTAIVSGDVVENLNEQQDADLEVAQKSAKVKEVLAALYTLAKRLQAEKNEEAYNLVKKTFLDISKSLKK